MGYGKNKNSINEWRIQERKILRELCEKHGLEISDEAQGRGKIFTPDEYKKIRDEAKEDLKTDPEILDEIKDEIRIEVEGELLSEQQHLVDEIAKNKKEVTDLQGKKSELQKDIKKEQKNFTDMQSQFQPRKDDVDRVNKISREASPSILGNKITVLKEDWEFIINIAKQHANISDVTLAALKKHKSDTDEMKRCQSLYLAVAVEVAALGYAGKSKLEQSVQDVLKDIEDNRLVSWAIDDMFNGKPSDLEEILEKRKAKITAKYNLAKKLREYNQPAVTHQKTEKQSNDLDR
jgi:hypothetical protein